MNGKYYAVVRRSDEDITHWKYIKREKVNGKWRYYYDDSELRKFDQGVTEKTTSKDGKHTTTKEITYQKSDKLFDPGESRSSVYGSTFSGDGNSYESQKITKSQGKLSRAIAKAERWIFDTFLDGRKNAKRKRDIERSINKGKTRFKNKFGIG